MDFRRVFERATDLKELVELYQSPNRILETTELWGYNEMQIAYLSLGRRCKAALQCLATLVEWAPLASHLTPDLFKTLFQIIERDVTRPSSALSDPCVWRFFLSLKTLDFFEVFFQAGNLPLSLSRLVSILSLSLSLSQVSPAGLPRGRARGRARRRFAVWTWSSPSGPTLASVAYQGLRDSRVSL